MCFTNEQEYGGIKQAFLDEFTRLSLCEIYLMVFRHTFNLLKDDMKSEVTFSQLKVKKRFFFAL